jgi:hypothetical protein
MINDYKILTGVDSVTFSRCVVVYLDQGYHLVGPLIVTYDPQDGGIWLRQVVAKGPNT